MPPIPHYRCRFNGISALLLQSPDERQAANSRSGHAADCGDDRTFENGDECAYISGTTRGAPGQFYKQVINGHHYLTQEDFSNSSFFSGGGGCLQS